MYMKVITVGFIARQSEQFSCLSEASFGMI